ncbi:hypothetical protein [Pseudomonas sp. MIACH]|uniref:hypothetical protein n=1 Tax=Pseudomonas sp. MIACH TaxID=1078355 RepID=UPI00069CC640|nr:hypothetical protein [Pseudomonas sp. MIACH]
MSDFKTEDRYIVIKRSDLVNHRAKDREMLGRALTAIGQSPRQYVVIESDWPEYHLVWAMLRHRMAGKPVPDFDLWRRADELQQRLTAADEQLDLLVAENTGMRTDVERYRWLRDRPLNTIHLGGVFAGKTPQNVVLNGEDLDQSIDAAIQSEVGCHGL